ncbi:hypothetical protein CHUAL_007972 [Chamberlinius hualienensis]
MPAIAVIGHVVRASHISPNDHVGSNGLNGRGESVTPAWQIPENVKSALNGSKTKTEPKNKQWSAYRRWMSKNRIAAQSSFELRPKILNPKNITSGNTSSSQKYRETPIASVALYMGIGMFLVGLVITIVGVGESGFNTLELQLIGPCLTGMGIIVCVIRVLVCCCADKCNYCDQLVIEPVLEEKNTKNVRNFEIENGISLPNSNSDVLNSGRKSVFRSVTPIPGSIPIPGSNIRIPGPMSSSTTSAIGQEASTSGGICIQNNSWDDASSLDFDFNDIPSPEQKEPGNNELDNLSSILSTDDSDDNDLDQSPISEFREIELKKMSSVEVAADEEVIPAQLIERMSSTNQQINNVNKNGSEREEEQKNGIKKQNGVILDPMQYLNRATLAAATKNI